MPTCLLEIRAPDWTPTRAHRRALAQVSSLPPRDRYSVISKLLLGSQLRGEELKMLLREQGVSEPTIQLNEHLRNARRIARNSRASIADRRFALSVISIGNLAQVQSDFVDLLAPQQPADLRDAVVDHLGMFQEDLAARILLRHVSTLSPRGRRAAIRLLVSRTSWAMLLLQAIKDHGLAPAYLSAQHRRDLLNSRVAEIAATANDILGSERSRADLTKEWMSRLTATNGSISRGKVLFRKVCVSCHRLDGQGTNVGPDLVPLRHRGAAL